MKTHDFECCCRQMAGQVRRRGMIAMTRISSESRAILSPPMPEKSWTRDVLDSRRDSVGFKLS